jgi:tetratricopeptide (TPR) repeat protein
MDGRWSLRLAGGLLGGLLGCSGPQTRPAADAPPAATAQAKPPAPGSLFSRSKPPAPAPEAPAVAAAPTKLKPATYVSIGSLKEGIADDANRPLPEREAARYQARQSYQKAIEIDAKYVPAYVALAKSYMLTGERDRAQATFKKAQALAPKDAGIWFEEGAGLARLKEWGAAVDCLAKAAQMDPDSKQYQRYLGFTLARAGRYDDGLAALAKCMPEAEARYNLARMLWHNQQAEAAEQQVRLAVHADPTFAPAQELLAEWKQGGGDPGVRAASYQDPAPVRAGGD